MTEYSLCDDSMWERGRTVAGWWCPEWEGHHVYLLVAETLLIMGSHNLSENSIFCSPDNCNELCPLFCPLREDELSCTTSPLWPRSTLWGGDTGVCRRWTESQDSWFQPPAQPQVNNNKGVMSFHQEFDPLILREDQDFPWNSPCGYFVPNPLPNQRRAANCGWNKGLVSKCWRDSPDFSKHIIPLFIFWWTNLAWYSTFCYRHDLFYSNSHT